MRERYGGYQFFRDVSYETDREIKAKKPKPEVLYQVKISHKVPRDGKK